MSDLEIDWFKISNILMKAIDKVRLFGETASLWKGITFRFCNIWHLHSKIILNTIVVDSSILKFLVKDTFDLRA